MLALLLTTAIATAAAQNPTDTRLLSQPAVSATRVAFTYAGDIFSAKLDGTDVRRLTTADGDESNPAFSPDGQWIAFTGNYDGNIDAYLVAATGGTPRRLPWHPSPDAVQGFTPDGRKIADESAGSGGDLLPWDVAQVELGTIVGKRTWGGLVGVLGFPTLMDGSTITAPNLASWTAEGGRVVENEGVPPDIEVEQTPADVIAGRDPQLERAIREAMDQLRKNPPAGAKRPPFPIRTKRP